MSGPIKHGVEAFIAGGFFRGVKLWVTRWDYGKAWLLDGETLAWVEDSDKFDPPASFRLSEENAQDLIDQLWRAGYRPASGRQSEGQFSAQSAHLADMRAIAFSKMEIEKP